MIKTLRVSIVLVLLPIFLGGCASRQPVKRKDEAVTVGSLSFFFSRALPNEMFVRATGSGSSREEAVRNALNAAVQQAMGVLVVSELTVSGDRLLQDLSASYSSGVVRNYSVRVCANDHRVTCTIDAITSPWAIRDAIFASSSRVRLDGESLYGQFITQRETIIQRRKLSEYYLSRIYTVGLVPTIRSIDVPPSAGEEALVRVRYSISWNKNFRNELINFLKILEKDTGGHIVRRHPNYGELLVPSSINGQEDQDVYFQWGPRRGKWINDELVIRSHDPLFAKIFTKYLYSIDIQVAIEPFGLCDRFRPEDGSLLYATSREQWREVTIKVPPEMLRNIKEIKLSTNC